MVFSGLLIPWASKIRPRLGVGGKGPDFIFEGEFHAPTQTKVTPGESGGNGVASQVGRQDVPLHVLRPHRPTVNDSLWMMN